ncbi:MAG TPA: DMT family transporter [Thermoanaerobaculia bacterium]|nr:DMT family transporter [Thermoanaerobaculia bacterium]
MPIPHSGEIAALGTAACWTVTALAFEGATRRAGSMSVNLLRLMIALPLLCAAAYAFRGAAFPTDATAAAWGWLSLSGLIGFALGDFCLFRALVLIGPRLATLVMSLVPPLTALASWLILGEILRPSDILGMALTVTGIFWAVEERRRANRKRIEVTHPWLGLTLALGGAVGQAVGLVLSKLGMGSYSAIASTQIRVFAGIAGFLVIFLALRRWDRLRAALADSRALRLTTVGAFFGPFLGVTLSLYAVQHALAGVAASIMATTPVLIIPVVVLSGKERVGWGGVGGAILAVAGVFLLFF